MTQRPANANEEREERSDEIRRLRRMLTELGELAEHASMTGSLERGAPAAVRRYNAVLERLQELGSAPSGFSRLGDEVSFDEIKVECTLLASYLDDDDGGRSGSRGGPPHAAGRGRKTNLALVAGLAPFVDRRELIELLRAHEQEGEQIDPELVLSLAPFLPKEEVSRLVRQHLGQRYTQKESGTPAPAADAAAPQTPAAAGPPIRPSESDERRRRMAQLDSRVDELLTQLRDDDLSDEARSRLIDEVSRVGGERAALRRQLEQE